MRQRRPTIWHPQQRLVAVQAWDADDDELKHALWPVLGVQADIVQFDDGSEAVQHEVLILVDNAITTLPDARTHYLEGIVETVLCPWPPEEDAEQLQPVVEALFRRLKQRGAVRAS